MAAGPRLRSCGHRDRLFSYVPPYVVVVVVIIIIIISSSSSYNSILTNCTRTASCATSANSFNETSTFRMQNILIWCFSDRASQYRLVSNYQLNEKFFYSITICMLHYNPRHVPSSTVLIFRKSNCIITASGIVTLCKRPYSMAVESGLTVRPTVRPFTKSDDTRCCNNTIWLPEDEQGTARNMSRIIT